MVYSTVRRGYWLHHLAVASKRSTFPRGMMQECDACGLIFGGSDVCPSCGSRISHEAKVEDTSSNPMPAGELPGVDQLVTSMDGVDGLSMGENQTLPKTSLPFSIGGSTGGQTTLPFGVGSPSRGVEESDSSVLAVEEQITPSPESEDEEVPELSPDIDDDNEEMTIILTPPPEPEPTPQVDSDTTNGGAAGDDVILVARVLSEGEPTKEEIPQERIVTSQAQNVEAETLDAKPVSSEGAFFTPEGAVSGVAQDVILHEEDVVYHDFGDEMQVSEVIVDFDSFVDPATSAGSFDPSAMEGTEPELMPARALAITGLNDSKLQEQAHIGFAALAQANWKEAANCFRIICESHPQNPAALNNFGLSLLQQALLIQEESPSQYPADEPHFEASVLALRQAAKASQDDVSIICNLATALSSCHRHDSAVKFYDVALNFDNNDVPSMNGKAVSCIGLRDFDVATQILRAASAIAPANEIVSGNLHRISPMG
ncbi:MAG: hypothetical protein QF885_02865 [Candidatus Thalassarchaeaceae archaeon]|nr:hypothetical protein [Candidatus Thalassarchaeaceae archaeon]